MRRFQLLLTLLALLTSCHRGKSVDTPTTIYPGFVSIDTANKMITSYLNSINYNSNDSDLRSLTINAAELRYYLDSIPNSCNIKSLEIKFAHKLSYINSGHKDQPAGFNANALTVVIVGLDQAGNYIYTGNNVLNRASPCPFACPAQGPILTR